MRNKLKNPFFLFVLGLGITLFIFSIYPAVRITNAQSDEGEKCVGNYDDGSCIQTLIKDCQAKFKYSERPKHLVTPTCDQTPDELRTITYKTGKQPFDEYCYPVRSCGLNDFVQLFVDLAIWGWWILPSLALLMFIWGGFLLLSSGGKQEQIQTAKRMLTSVLIGSVIVLLLAWVITGLVISMLTGEKGGLIFGKPWFGGSEVTPNTGCCITKFICYENWTEEKCLDESLREKWVARQPCFKEGSTAYTLCKNKTGGCCVPKDLNSHECEIPKAESGCADFPNTELKSDDCALINQCLPPPGSPEIKGCCTPDDGSGDCEESSSGICVTPGTSLQEKGCSFYGQCLGCCVDDCKDFALFSECRPPKTWHQGQKCTPADCGLTCCSDKLCEVGKPNVELGGCGDVFESPEPTGECFYRQIAFGCCRVLNTCFEHANIYYCEALGAGVNWEIDKSCLETAFCGACAAGTEPGCTWDTGCWL